MLPFINEIAFELTDETSTVVGFEMFDNLGNIISGGTLTPSRAKIAFDGTRLPSGVYFVKINCDKKTSVQKVVKL